MTQAELPKIFHLQFTPEQWSQLVRLRALIGKPLPTTRESYQALDGLLYTRMIEPSPDLNFNSGHCASWNWFEKEPEKFCPLAKQCGAYTRKWPGGDVAALAAT